MEIWLPIQNYEGLYEISSLGRIKRKSGEITVSSCNQYKEFTYKIKTTEKILKPRKDKNGYLIAHLCKCGKHRNFSVHRLVANAFIPNPNNYDQINHKNEDKRDNCVNNLEWCDAKYNCNYGTRIERILEIKRKKYEE